MPRGDSMQNSDSELITKMWAVGLDLSLQGSLEASWLSQIGKGGAPRVDFSPYGAFTPITVRSYSLEPDANLE